MCAYFVTIYLNIVFKYLLHNYVIAKYPFIKMIFNMQYT